jgi:hypothetical protein
MRGLSIIVTEDGYEVHDFDGELAELQAVVDGSVEPIPTDERVTIWVNDEGKYLTPRVNRLAMDVWLPWDVFHCMLVGRDWIAGNAVVTGGVDADGNTMDIPADAHRWVERVARDAGATRVNGDQS